MKVNQRFRHLNPTDGTEKHGPVLIAEIITRSKKPPFENDDSPAHRPMSSSMNEGVPLSPEETSSSSAFHLALSALAIETFVLEGFRPRPRPRVPTAPELPTSSTLALPLDFDSGTSEPTFPGGVILGMTFAGTGEGS